MTEYYNPNELAWYFSSSPMIKGSKSWEMKANLKYCESCEHVWEQSCAGTITRYSNLPTIHLKRRVCRYCNG